MKNFFFVPVLLLLVACSSKKNNSDSANKDLEDRLEAFMRVNEKMDLEKVMDYTYPKLFTIAPRSEVIKTMQATFDNEEVKIKLDSMRIEKIHPVFTVNKGQYAKVDYSMLMLMDFKIKDTASSQKELIKQAMAAQYGIDKVRLDENGTLRINIKSPMIAAKDAHSKEWTFVNFKDGDQMSERLFPKEVIEKIKTYN